MNEKELKRKFAELLLKYPKEYFKAALEIFPDNTSKALRIANEWINDSEVIQFQNEILAEKDELEFLPSKAELCRDVYNRMKTCVFDSDFKDLAKLYAEIRGFIQKPNFTINNSNGNIDNRVMKVIDFGSDDDWQKRVEINQKTIK
jgi:hypothetical protein